MVLIYFKKQSILKPLPVLDLLVSTLLTLSLLPLQSIGEQMLFIA
jgi:hypothetical protein